MAWGDQDFFQNSGWSGGGRSSKPKEKKKKDKVKAPTKYGSFNQSNPIFDSRDNLNTMPFDFSGVKGSSPRERAPKGPVQGPPSWNVDTAFPKLKGNIFEDAQERFKPGPSIDLGGLESLIKNMGMDVGAGRGPGKGLSSGNKKAPPRPAMDVGGIQKGILGGGGQQGPAMFEGTLSDYLSRAGNGENLIASQLAALNQQRESGRQQQASGDSQIAEMYAALQRDLKKQQRETSARYSQSNKDSIASSNAANAAIQQAQKNVTGTQNETLKNLGISDAGGQARETQAGYNTQNTAATATNANAARQNLAAQGAAQGDYLGGNVSAAGFRGNERRSDLLEELQQYLSGINNNESQLRDQAAQQAQQMAQQQFQSDQDSFYRQQDYLQGMDDRAYSRGMDRYNMDMQQQQMDMEGAQAQAEGMPDMSIDNKGGLANAQNYLGSLGFRDPQTGSNILNKVQQAWAESDPISGNRYGQAVKALRAAFGGGDGTQLRAAINALTAFLGSSGITK